MAIKQYSLAKNGDRRLAPDFKVRELRCRDGSDTVMVDEALTVVLQCIREHFGKPVTIAAYAESLMPDWGGVGRYPVKAGRATGWVHVDTRADKARWRG